MINQKSKTLTLEEFLPKEWESSPQCMRTLQHSKTVANAARIIASKTSTLDPQKAYTYGLMHDVGKFYIHRSEKYKHPRLGYELLKDQYHDVANICITHPFPNFDSFEHILHYCHLDEVEAQNIYIILKTIKKDDYVQLIQLCDKISRTEDYISWEGKLNWYINTYNLSRNELIGQYSEKLGELKSKFDKMVDADVYELVGISDK